MQAVRLAGDVVVTIGARRWQPGLMAVGLMIVIAGWSHGLVGWRRLTPLRHAPSAGA
jgi:hypothetical protein